jgi:hypothetical protein
MGEQQITDSERMERIFARLYEKAMAVDKGDLLTSAGWMTIRFSLQRKRWG